MSYFFVLIPGFKTNKSSKYLQESWKNNDSFLFWSWPNWAFADLVTKMKRGVEEVRGWDPPLPPPPPPTDEANVSHHKWFWTGGMSTCPIPPPPPPPQLLFFAASFSFLLFSLHSLDIYVLWHSQAVKSLHRVWTFVYSDIVKQWNIYIEFGHLCTVTESGGEH